jgi:hypothetical protein
LKGVVLLLALLELLKMKFFKQMEANMVQEWTDKYVDYRLLKKQINAIKEKSIRLAQALAEITGL